MPQALPQAPSRLLPQPLPWWRHLVPRATPAAALCPPRFRKALLPLAAALPVAATLALGAQTPAAASATLAPRTTQPAPASPATQTTPAIPTSAPTTPAPELPGKPPTPRERKSAARSYDHGITELRAKHYEAAAQSFAAAIHDDPTVAAFYQALSVAQEARITGLLQGAAQQRPTNPAAADRLLAQARGLDPTNPRVTQRDAQLATAGRPQSVTALQQLHFVPAGAIDTEPNRNTQSFHLTTDTRAFATQLGQVYGLRVMIDPDLQSKPFRIDLDSADYATTLKVFGLVAGIFASPLDQHSILIATDNAQNRKRYEHLLEQTVPLPGYSTEDIAAVGTMLRTVFDLPDQRQVQSTPLLNAITIRAPEDTLHAMDTVLADLVDSGSEVTVDVKLYSVDTSKVQNLGVTLPTSFTLFSARSEIQNVLNSNSSLIQQLLANGALPASATPAEIAAYLVFVAGLGNGSVLQNTLFLFGGGLSSLTSNSGNVSSFGVTPVGFATSSFPAINLALQNSQATSLDDLQLRVANNQNAIFKAGSRYPIQTAIYSDLATSSTASGALSSLLSQYLGSAAASSLSSVPTIPQFQYQDIGLTVNATPRVMSQGEVALKLDIKITALSGTSINGIPVLASRDFSSSLQLNDGETVVMASHVQNSEAAAVSGIPGLNSIPGLGSLTNRSDNDSHTTLVLLVTPHIVRHSHDEKHGPYVPLQNRPDTD